VSFWLIFIVEWTQALTKFLHEQLQKIIEHYKGTGTQVGFLTAGPTSVIDMDAATRQWNYVMLLVQHMYDDGLIDRHEFLSWLIELLEKVKVADDTVLKLIMGQVLRVSVTLLLCFFLLFCILCILFHDILFLVLWIYAPDLTSGQERSSKKPLEMAGVSFFMDWLPCLVPS